MYLLQNNILIYRILYDKPLEAHKDSILNVNPQLVYYSRDLINHCIGGSF